MKKAILDKGFERLAKVYKKSQIDFGGNKYGVTPEDQIANRIKEDPHQFEKSMCSNFNGRINNNQMTTSQKVVNHAN